MTDPAMRVNAALLRVARCRCSGCAATDADAGGCNLVLAKASRVDDRCALDLVRFLLPKSKRDLAVLALGVETVQRAVGRGELARDNNGFWWRPRSVSD